ncbi:unannotated protein [freshwater metagenome]|uniref:Unannotated protein n=1 Tax=freshwater metagenome TaxID=449393 RepID=A0A6J7FJ25_9ZZZZ|nr:hypothetical protein [Actinomycetota bacterium]
MHHPRRSSHGRRTLAVSVLTAGAVAVSGSAAMVATAQAAPATTRDVQPADPVTPVTAILALVAQLTEAINPLVVGLASADLTKVVAGLTDSQLGQLLTQLTGVQIGEVLSGAALNRALAAVTSLTSPQLVALLQNAADSVRDGVPAPVGFVLETLLDVTAGVLSERGVQIPSQVADLIALPAVATPAARPAAAPSVLRARIFDAVPARDRRSVRVELTCPAVSDAVCPVVVRTTVAGAKAATARRVTITRGRSKVVRPTLTAKARKRLQTRGGTVRITATTTGSKRGPVTTTVRVPAPRGR